MHSFSSLPLPLSPLFLLPLLSSLPFLFQQFNLKAIRSSNNQGRQSEGGGQLSLGF